MAFKCPFCNRILSTRSAYSQHVKRCSENFDSSSEEIFIRNESDIFMTEREVININEIFLNLLYNIINFLIILFI
jgi:hypothetical protein